MARPMMFKEEDVELIDDLCDDLQLKTKVDVVRAGLKLLQEKVERMKRVARWKKAVHAVYKTSEKVNREMQKHSRLKSIPEWLQNSGTFMWLI